MTSDDAEGLQYHVLPTDDRLCALNILREATGLQPLSDERDNSGGQVKAGSRISSRSFETGSGSWRGLTGSGAHRPGSH